MTAVSINNIPVISSAMPTAQGLHPRVAFSPFYGPNNPLPTIEMDIPTTLNPDINIETFVPTREEVLTYLSTPSCKIPKLPSNVTVKFTGDLAVAVQAFSDTTKDEKARIASQKLVERSLVEKGSCATLNPEIVTQYRLRIFTLDDGALDQTLNSIKSMDANLQDQISCALDAIIYNGKSAGEYSPLLRERIRHWFPNLVQIGDESVEGYALKTSFSSNSNLFIMKAPRNPKNDELVHEALVGFYGLNKLRHILPNYMYVYGYTKCSPPALNNKQALTWCSSSTPPVSYLITENIRDAVTIGSFIRNYTITVKDTIAVFLQLFNALNLAYKYYGYTHYDLHYGNVMVRKYDRPVGIPYFGVSNTIMGYIVTQYVPYIIDYGYSRIAIGGVGFGKIGLEDHGIEGARPFPMFDVYKIITFTAERLYTNPAGSNYAGLSDLLTRLFAFFNQGAVYERIKTRLLNITSDWYNLQENWRSVTHDQYLIWLQNQSGIPLSIVTDLRPLTSQGIFPAPINTYMDTCEFYSLFTVENGPQTALEFCEVVSALNEDNQMALNIKQDALTWLNNHFNSEEYFESVIPTFQKLIAEANDIESKNRIIQGAIIPNISQSSNISTSPFILLYRDRLLIMLRLKEIASDINSYLRSNICALATQGQLATYKSDIDYISKAATDLTNFINKQRIILRDNIDYVNKTNWNVAGIDPIVTKFWTEEHENLVLAV
ncbi:Protein kinase [uncultured virus]|nr:Protein kinase [uncultured virus]